MTWPPRLGRAQFDRFLRYPSQSWLVFRFVAGFLVGLAALVGLAYVIGAGPFGDSDGVVHAVTEVAARPAVSLGLAIPPLALCTWCVRRLWLQYLGWLPGTILVRDFTTAGDFEGVAPVQLTTEFRNRLATLRVQMAAPAPGAPPPSNFLDIVSQEEASLEPGLASAIAQLANVVRAAFPATALEVRGTLVKREDKPERYGRELYGVSLQVARLPDQGSSAEDVWDTSWERAVRRAADVATAAILPRTRLCKGPWVTWRGYVMPPDLFRAFEDASRLESEQRYYPALESCYRALEQDPLNRAVRLQLGKLQEQLGLFLDALGTYESILLTARPAGHLLPRRLYRRAARLARTRLDHLARYRQIVLLGGDSLADEWICLRGRVDDRQRAEMEELLLKACGSPVDLKTGTEPDVRKALCASADQKARELTRALRWWRATHPLRTPHLLPRTVAVTNACVADRVKFLERQAEDVEAPDVNARIKEMDKTVRRCGRLTGLRSWQSHYNAACLYARPLNDEYKHESARPLASQAVDQLALAAGFADSAFLSTRKAWLVSEDPDLKGLREQPEFSSFVSQYFPEPETTPHHLAEAHERATRYTYELVRNMATTWAEIWQQRSKASSDERERLPLPDWWRDERKVWGLIQSIAANPADWRAHLSLVRAKGGQDARYPVKFVEPRFERTAAEPSEAERRKARLGSLSQELSSTYEDTLLPAAELGDPLPGWLGGAEDPLADEQLRRICLGRALLWTRLHVFLGSDTGEPELESLSSAVREVRRLELSVVGPQFPDQIRPLLDKHELGEMTAEKFLEEAQRLLQPAPATPGPAPTPPIPPTSAAAAPDIAEEIEKLADLKAKGILTDEEFATKKAELLARM